ncbi:hypothetical protein HDK77DRAFT_448710 [Phyllosticta capitalensis]|uniref:Uncharacterized protein n=1 Tax=Phyllosticta capitalensis TaxID=121624 RepID=A0ABR1YF67_9PEZI
MGDGRPRWTFGWDGMVVSLFAFFVLGCRRGVPNSLNASLNFVFFLFSSTTKNVTLLKNFQPL